MSACLTWGAVAGTALAAALSLYLPASAQPSLAHRDGGYDCVVEPSLSVKLGSPIVGLLSEVSVGRGAVVAKGQVVARMHDALERASVAVGEARARSTAEIDAEKARLKLARADLERAEQLVSRQVIARERVQELRAEVEVGVQNVRKAELERHLAQLELERARVTLAERAIASPVDGVVTERLLSAGEYIHQEAYILEIARLDPLHVETFLPVDIYGSIQPGQEAAVMLQQPVGGSHEAVVDVVDKVLDAASGTFGVRLKLNNPELSLPAGIRCKVTFAEASGVEAGDAGSGNQRSPKVSRP